MNKFEKSLNATSKSIKAGRAKIIAASSEDAQNEIVRKLKKGKRDLELQLLNLTDISPDSELSLKVVKSGFNAESLFKEIQEVKISLANQEVELSLAEETYREFFSEEK